MHNRHVRPVRALVYFCTLFLLAIFILAPAEGIADGNGGLPVGQQNDSTYSTTSVSETEPSQEEESDKSLLTIIWELAKLLI